MAQFAMQAWGKSRCLSASYDSMTFEFFSSHSRFHILDFPRRRNCATVTVTVVHWTKAESINQQVCRFSFSWKKQNKKQNQCFGLSVYSCVLYEPSKYVPFLFIQLVSQFFCCAIFIHEHFLENVVREARQAVRNVCFDFASLE